MNTNTHAGKTLRMFLSQHNIATPLYAVLNCNGAVIDWSNRELHMRAVLDVAKDEGIDGSLVVILEPADIEPEAIPYTIQ